MKQIGEPGTLQCKLWKIKFNSKFITAKTAATTAATTTTAYIAGRTSSTTQTTATTTATASSADEVSCLFIFLSILTRSQYAPAEHAPPATPKATTHDASRHASSAPPTAATTAAAHDGHGAANE